MNNLVEEPVGKWQRFKSWLNSFEVYQIFVVRAWRKKTSRGWYVLMSIPGIVAYCILCLWLQHAATLDEMRKETGVVESFGIGRNCAVSLSLLGDDGELHYYALCERDKSLPQRVIGKRATVWSEGGKLPPLLWRRHLMQLQVGTTPEIKLDQERATLLTHGFKRIFLVFFVLTLLLLFPIWWDNRKDDSDQNAMTKL